MVKKFKVLQYYHLFYVGKRRLICIGEIEKNEMIKSIMKRQVFFIYLSFRMFFFLCFFVCFWFVVFDFFSSIHILLVMLFIHAAKRSNSLSQLFFKTGVLKNFTIFIGNVCVGAFFTGLKARILIKKETPTQVFSCEYCKIFNGTVFLWNTCSSCFSKILCDDRY